MSLNELQPFCVSLTRMSVEESPGKCRVPTCIRQKGIYSTFITKRKSAIRKYVIKLSYYESLWCSELSQCQNGIRFTFVKKSPYEVLWTTKCPMMKSVSY